MPMMPNQRIKVIPNKVEKEIRIKDVFDAIFRYERDIRYQSKESGN
jgi:hypothetical protein